MEILLVLFMNIVFGLIIICEYRIKSLSLMFWTSIFVVFSIPHSLELILSTNIYSIKVMNKASLFVIGFNILYLLSRYIFVYRKTKFNWEISEFNGNIENRFIRYLFLSMILSVILWIIGLYQVTGNILNVSWSDTLLVSGGFSIIASYLFMTGCGVLLLLYLKRKGALLWITFIILALIVILLTRARINLIPLFLPIIVYQVFYKRNYTAILKVMMLGLAFIVVVSFIQEFRFLGSLTNARNSDIGLVFKNSINSLLNGQGEFGLRRAMYKFIDNNNKFINFNKGITYIRLLLIPFPNSIIKIKPRDFAYDMWDAVNPHRTGIGGTYHPTFFGDLYGNFGDYGFVFGIIWALIFLGIDKITNKLSNEVKITIIAPFATMYLLLARGSVYNAIANGFWSFVILNIIFFMSRITIHSVNK